MVVTKSAAINACFKQYHTESYQAEIPVEPSRISEFIISTNLPQLSHEQVAAFEEPVTVEEITTAIASLSTYKAPCPDGIPNEVYLLAAEEIACPLLNMFLEALQTASLPTTLPQADILILKLGKAPDLHSSYRPIVLINSDDKDSAGGSDHNTLQKYVIKMERMIREFEPDFQL